MNILEKYPNSSWAVMHDALVHDIILGLFLYQLYLILATMAILANFADNQPTEATTKPRFTHAISFIKVQWSTM